MNKKPYLSPSLSVFRLRPADVICTSDPELQSRRLSVGWDSLNNPEYETEDGRY